jgi:DNA-binding CsgD family transcriptional regulator
MARLRGTDEERLATLRRALANRERSLDETLEEVRLLVGADRVLAYTPRWRPGGYKLAQVGGAGFSSLRRLSARLAAMLARRDRPWALFNPLVPEAAQRNRVVALPAPSGWRGATGQKLLSRLGHEATLRERLARRMERLNAGPLAEIELADLHVCRALVCRGAELRAFVGAFRRVPFDARERQLLAALVAPIAARLTEEGAASADREAQTIEGLLELAHGAALIVEGDGAVAFANAAGWQALAERPLVGDTVRALLAGRDVPSARLHPLPLPASSSGPRHLVLLSDGSRRAAALARWSRQWRLTARESQILDGILDGASTKSLAERCGPSVRVVEHHLTHLYRKAGVSTRGELLGRLLADAF